MMNDAIISVTLRDAAVIAAGYPLRGSVEALDEGNAAIIQLKNADLNSGISWDSLAKVSLPSSRAPKWLTENDVIFSARGTRNYAYSMKGAPKYTVCSPHFFVLSVKDTDNVDPQFLAWQLNQKPAQDYFKRMSQGSLAVNTLRRPALEEIRLALPPIERQKVIVEFWQSSQKEEAALRRLIHNRTQQSDAIAYGLQTHAKEA